MDNGRWGVDSERGIVEKSIPVLKETEKRPWSGWSVVDGGQWVVDGGQWTVDSGWWIVDSGCGQWAVDSGQLTMDSG